VYIGYYHKDKWGYRTIEIENESLTTDSVYVINKDVNLRTQYPKLTWRGYDFGDSPGQLMPEQEVLILEQKEIGKNKIWARIRIEK